MKSPQRPAISGRSKFAFAATLLTVPMLALPALSAAEKAPKRDRPPQQQARDSYSIPHVLEKSGRTFTVVGIENGRTILKGRDGKLFYLDPKTGDQKFLAAGHTVKHQPGQAARMAKHRDGLTLLGVDAKGNTVMKNAKGEKFYLEPSTGDMVFIK
jgi:hypothetical protein